MIDWDTYNDHEPLWGPMRDLGLSAETIAAGFEETRVTELAVPTGRILQSGKSSKTGQLWLPIAERQD
jgi:hypothetical protein